MKTETYEKFNRDPKVSFEKHNRMMVEMKNDWLKNGRTKPGLQKNYMGKHKVSSTVGQIIVEMGILIPIGNKKYNQQFRWNPGVEITTKLVKEIIDKARDKRFGQRKDAITRRKQLSSDGPVELIVAEEPVEEKERDIMDIYNLMPDRFTHDEKKIMSKFLHKGLK